MVGRAVVTGGRGGEGGGDGRAGLREEGGAVVRDEEGIVLVQDVHHVLDELELLLLLLDLESESIGFAVRP